VSEAFKESSDHLSLSAIKGVFPKKETLPPKLQGDDGKEEGTNSSGDLHFGVYLMEHT
jgi:hypothetical protein